MLDHGTGVVIGETSTIGRNCTFLHGITLGGTGNAKTHDRHPKIGNNVFLGCQATILGNIQVGNHVIVGAGSLVLKPLPDGAVAVGSPAVVKRIQSNFDSIVVAGDGEVKPCGMPEVTDAPATISPSGSSASEPLEEGEEEEEEVLTTLTRTLSQTRSSRAAAREAARRGLSKVMKTWNGMWCPKTCQGGGG
jgi:hypothetical protein